MSTAYSWHVFRRPGAVVPPAIIPEPTRPPHDVLQWASDRDAELSAAALSAALEVADSVLLVHDRKVRVALDRGLVRGHVLASSARRHLAGPELSEPLVGRAVLQLTGPVAEGQPWLQRWHPQSLVSLPLTVDGRSHGALLALTYTRAIDSDGLQSLRALAERAALRLALREVREQLQLSELTLDSAPSPAVGLDASGRIRVWNKAAAEVYGLSREQAQGRPLTELVHTDASGEVAWQESHQRPITPVHVSTTTRDNATGISFTDRSAELLAVDELSRQQHLSAMLLESVPGRACVLDRRGHVMATNGRFDREGPLGRGKRSALPLGRDYLAWATGVDESLHDCLRGVLVGDLQSASLEMESTYRRKQRWTEIHATASPWPEASMMVLHLDITARREAELDLEHRATHDPLTGLPNRVLLVDRLTHALARSARTRGDVGILYCDLDRFKEVNTQFGHTGGDSLLIEVATRLQRACRTSDTVARVSGDEFVILLEDVTGPEEMEEVAHRILHALSVPVELDGRKALTGMSIGMVLSPGIPGAGMSNVQKLVQEVDAAMFAAKDAGRNRFAWFSPEMLEKDHARPNFLEAMAKRILNR